MLTVILVILTVLTVWNVWDIVCLKRQISHLRNGGFAHIQATLHLLSISENLSKDVETLKAKKPEVVPTLGARTNP